MIHPDREETNEIAAPAGASRDVPHVPEEHDQCALRISGRSRQIPFDDRTQSEKEDDDRAEERYWDDRREEGYEAARDYASSDAGRWSASRLRGFLSGWRRWIMDRIK
ncbi:hypothetical protein [Caballeronia sordidicola]|uniref:hypothetical protein n=1 Tax=Caballeronia sordidicola TaxID=196367 RepID=UPI000B777EB5|nr:hypothetical protein [Caballeronia sordidicola]